MKEFFQRHSYNMVKMFLNQIVTAVFGLTLALVAGQMENPTFRNICSIASIAFYLFLLYNAMWNIGFKERAAIQRKEKANIQQEGFLYHPCTGFFIGFGANILNFVLAIFVMIGMLVDVSFFNNVGGVCSVIALIIEGMYTGILANKIGKAPLNAMWWMYFVIIIPAIIITGIAYIAGTHDFSITKKLKPNVENGEVAGKDKYGEN